MMRVMLFAAAMLLGAPAQAERTYYLESQWVKNGNRFCKYSDGSVLNVGVRLCPLTIRS
jgi:hypothetical protein